MINVNHVFCILAWVVQIEHRLNKNKFPKRRTSETIELETPRPQISMAITLGLFVNLKEYMQNGNVMFFVFDIQSLSTPNRWDLDKTWNKNEAHCFIFMFRQE